MRLNYTIQIDSREQWPYTFKGLVFGTNRKPRQIETSVAKLDAGDYSIVGYTDKIAIERKSAKDLYNTLIYSRERFERELGRMENLVWSAVLVETNWDTFIRFVQRETKCNPVSIDNLMLAMQIYYPRTHWIFRPGREASAKTVVKIFDLFLKRHLFTPGNMEIGANGI